MHSNYKQRNLHINSKGVWFFLNLYENSCKFTIFGKFEFGFFSFQNGLLNLHVYFSIISDVVKHVIAHNVNNLGLNKD